MDLLRPHNQHPSVVGKLLYFAVLHWGKGEVALLPLVTWALTVAMSLALLALLRWSGAASGRGLPLVFFLVNTVLFSLTQGHVWVWEFLVFNAVPSAALVVGLAVVAVPERLSMTARVVVVAVLSLGAVFGFGSGFLVPCLLLPMLLLRAWARDGWGWGRLLALAVVWLGGTGLATLVAFGVIGPVEAPPMPRAEGRLEELLSRPGEVALFLLVLLGRVWGQGTELDPALQSALAGGMIMAAGLGAGWLLVRAGGWRESVARLWPWVALVGYAMANMGLICWGRMADSMVAALDDRYVAFTQFAMLGVLGVGLLGVRRLEDTGRAAGLRVLMRRWAGAGLALWGVLTALANVSGWQALRCLHQQMEAQRAGMVFAKILPVDLMPFWGELVHAVGQSELAIYLAEQGRLRKVQMLEKPEVAAVKQQARLAQSKAVLRSLEVVGEGGWRIRGFCAGAEGWETRPAVVAISLTVEGKPERWVALGAPDMVDDFYEDAWMRRRYREHYYGWESRVPAELVAGLGDGVLRAYAFEVDRRAFRVMEGQISTVGLPRVGRFVRVAEERR